MPSIESAGGFHRNNKNLDGGNSRPSVHWNGTNGGTTWGSNGANSHYSAPVNRNMYYGNGGPITTVLAPPKHPCLINLDPLGTSFFQYPLLPGVTMLGTGRGCPKPPDLVLHGTGVEPQHCFIERNPIDDEVILHPICERTTVDDVQICGPTPLVPGNLVTIGGTHIFRFDGPTTSLQLQTAVPPTTKRAQQDEQEHEDTGILQRLQMIKQQKMRQQAMKSEQEESPYAIINPGAGNPLRSAGDVNKNSLHGLKIMDPLLNYEQERPERNPQDLRRGFDPPAPPSRAYNVSNGNHRNGTSFDPCGTDLHKFIKGGGGGDYVNQNQSRNLLPRNEFESRRMMFDGGDLRNNNNNSCSNEHYGNNSNGNGLSVQNNGQLHNSSSSSGVVNSFDKSELSKCFDRQDSGRTNYYYCSTPVRDTSLSSPPFFNSSSSRLASSSSMETSSRFNGNNNGSPDSFTCRTHKTPDGQYHRDEAIACETLLEIKRKQAHEARLAADMTHRSEKLRLEEILAMCAEYEEQIAREIKETTPPNHPTSTHPIQSGGGFTLPSSNNGSSQSSSKPFVSSPDKPTEITTPKSPTLYGYSRIKTNGSLPRDKKPTMSATSESSRCHSNNSSAVADDEIASIFTFSPTIGIPNDVFLPSNNNTASIPNTPTVCQRRPDEIDTSLVPPTSAFRSNIKSPYENVGGSNGNNNNGGEDKATSNPPLSPRTRIRTTLGKVPNDAVYSTIRRPIITTVVGSKENNISSPPPAIVSAEVGKSPVEKPRGKSPTKSKLTVTFSSSVQDIPDDSERERRSDLKSGTSSSPPLNDSKEQEIKSPAVIATTQVQVHVESDSRGDTKSNGNQVTMTSSVLPPAQNSYILTVSSSSPDSAISENSRMFPVVITENPAEVLKKSISEVEQQEMEAIREMEIEKALLYGEENSLESQIASLTKESKELRAKLGKMDESNRQWRAESLEHIASLKLKLNSSEKELERFEKIQDNFEGNSEEESSLLEQLKHQHELVETDRKAFEDAEFYHMEEEINREGQRDELSKIVSELDRKVLARRAELEQLQSQNRISFTSSAKEVQKLEEKRQELIQELRQLRESIKLDEKLLQIPDPVESISDNEDVKNTELEEKLRALSLFSSSTDDAIRIERIKSRSPIDPLMRTIGAKTCETLREIERNREFMLNEQGVQMLEQERQRVRELQKRVQDAVREEWEASRKTRNNQCHSLNSVGSEDSTQTISDTPTDSGSGDDTTDTSGAPSVSTTDMSLNTMSGGVSTEKFGQMRQKRDMSDGYEETRPLSDGSAYDDGSTIVTMREKHRVQSRPLTRYLPVRGDEERFDLRAFIESSGHQLELCPHIIVTGTAARGFLSKLGSRFNNWVKRWFVFDRETRTLSYYIDKGEKKARGGIHFQAIEEVYVDHLQSVKSPQPKLTFCVKTSSRVFHLMAPSPEAMRMWVDIIFTGAEGYQEFRNGTS